MAGEKEPWVEAQERVLKEGWKPLPERSNVLVAVFTYARQLGADILTYCTRLYGQMVDHPHLNQLEVAYSFGYPTDRCRNHVVKSARANKFDFVLMLDDDQIPDLLLGKEPGAVPFLPTALDFCYEHKSPCMVGAPYCSGPPGQEVVVMKHREYAPDNLNGCGLKIDKYTRDEAAVLTGIQRVAALPTGCLLADLRAFDVIEPPWFYYEYVDPPYNTLLASTEDVVLTRNADWLGIPQYCHWSAWAGHSKQFVVGKPAASPVADIPRAIYTAWSNGWRPASVPAP